MLCNEFYSSRLTAVEYIIYCKIVNIFETYVVYIIRRKRMNTDPRLLTGQKGASTLTQWYDNEISGATSEDHRSFGSCTEINSVSCVFLWK